MSDNEDNSQEMEESLVVDATQNQAPTQNPTQNPPESEDLVQDDTQTAAQDDTQTNDDAMEGVTTSPALPPQAAPSNPPSTPLSLSASATPRTSQVPQTPATPLTSQVPSTPLSALSTPDRRRNLPRAGLGGGGGRREIVPATPGTPMSDFGSEPGSPPLQPPGGGAAAPNSPGLGAANVFNPPPPPPAPMGEDAVEVVRGSNIEVPLVASAFRDFLLNFKSVEISQRRERKKEREERIARGEDVSDDEMEEFEDDEMDEDEPSVYVNELEKLFRTQSPALNLDCIHLYNHSPSSRRLYNWLVDYPQEIIHRMDEIATEVYRDIVLHLQRTGAADPDAEEEERFVQVRPFHFRKVSHMRALDPSSIDSMVTLQGMVLRSSPIIPDLKIAHFKCCVCGLTKETSLDRGKIKEPSTCDGDGDGGCGARWSFEIVHNRSVFMDKQLVRLQETPDEVPAGETPASVTLFAYDDIVDSVRPGDRVEVTGVFRAMPKRPNPKRTVVRTVFRTYVDVIHFRVMKAGEIGGMKAGLGEKDASKDKDTRGGFSEHRIRQMEELGKRPDIYDLLTKSLAPSIWELEDVKRGILCMLFGGNSKRIKTTRDGEASGSESDSDSEDDAEQTVKVQGSSGRGTSKLNKRGDVNILLCGDPGTSKSQLLGYVHKIAPRGVYTSGKGSSAVGLTASVVRDPETRELVLESGGKN